MKQQSKPRESQGSDVPVTIRHVILACYVVVVGISMLITGTFFPESFIGRQLVGGPWSIAWWVVLLVPVYILDRILQHLERR